MFHFTQRYGPWALVTGAARGTGAAFAEALARRGLHLLLVDVLASELASRAEQLRTRYPELEIETLALDLAHPDSLKAIDAALAERTLGLLVSNAAHAPVSSFFDTPLEDHMTTLDVNARATLALVHRWGSRLRDQRRGGLLLMSSLSALRGPIFVTTYAATKAFGLILGEGLAEELRPHNVDVLTVIPGALNTPGFHSHPHARSALFNRFYMEPEPVIEEALDALGHRNTLIPGRLNRLQAFFMHRLLPRSRAVQLLAHNLRRLYPSLRH